VLDIPKYGTVNVHASLLPLLRGPNPIQWSILQGHAKTGITTMLTDIGVDTGDMLLKHEVEIGDTDTAVDLAEKLSQAGGPLLVETLRQLRAGTLKPQPQPHEQATHGPKLDKDAGLLNWNEPARDLDAKIRGQQPSPGAYTHLNGERVKILRSRYSPVLENNSEDFMKSTEPGTIVGMIKEGVLVKAGDGFVELLDVQPAGKRTMSAKDWAQGTLRDALRQGQANPSQFPRFE
jgi:methionyl-tRNA formyltransferase